MPVSQSPAKPLYADRRTGQVFDHPRDMVDAYITRFSQRAGVNLPPLDAEGFTHLQKGTARVQIQVLADHGVLLLFAPVLALEGRTPTEALYRRLLEASFLATSDAAFAIDTARDEIVVRALRRISGLDYEEFEDLLETVGEVADSWDGTLARDVAEAP